MLVGPANLLEDHASGGTGVAKGRLWNRPELMLAVDLYCRTTFGRLHKTNPDVVSLASALDRTPSSVAMKLTNFASLDETIEQTGMSNVSAADREIWSEFFAEPAAFLDRVSSVRQSQYALPESTPPLEVRERLDVEYTAKGRRNQDFFRQAVLAAYNGRCALTGISQSELLVASHIVGWTEDKDLRVRPSNGICLNALHDRAFDRHLISFENDLTLVGSRRLKMTKENKPFFDGLKLTLPARFHPDPACLSRHRDRMLEKDRAA
jgi:putative restriction endonuclease